VLRGTAFVDGFRAHWLSTSSGYAKCALASPRELKVHCRILA
jgi:hypothetical protein